MESIGEGNQVGGFTAGYDILISRGCCLGTSRRGLVLRVGDRTGTNRCTACRWLRSSGSEEVLGGERMANRRVGQRTLGARMSIKGAAGCGALYSLTA